jgi:hypothetical protein
MPPTSNLLYAPILLHTDKTSTGLIFAPSMSVEVTNGDVEVAYLWGMIVFNTASNQPYEARYMFYALA